MRCGQEVCAEFFSADVATYRFPYSSVIYSRKKSNGCSVQVWSLTSAHAGFGVNNCENSFSENQHQIFCETQEE